MTFPSGVPISKTAMYTVAANSFIATDCDGFTVLKEGTSLGSDLDALETYVSRACRNSSPPPTRQ